MTAQGYSMKITILTLFPKMIAGFFAESIVKRAQEKKLAEINLVNIRQFASDKYGTVDDRPYGGGAGMVMKVDVLHKAIKSITDGGLRTDSKNPQSAVRNSKSSIILTSARGKIFNQAKARTFSKLDSLIIIAGHYEEVDERVREYIDDEISLGDFVMTGGEITAAAVADSVVRLIPGVLKKDEATRLESFFTVPVKRLIEVTGENKTLLSLIKKGREKVRLLEYPQYTRPADFLGKKVPGVLLSGDHREIEKWKLKMSFAETLKKRPDLLAI